MNVPKISIAGLMAIVVITAMGLAALKYSSELWASTMFSIVVGMLLFALIGVAFRRGNKQLFWAGFAVFGWGYLTLAIVTQVLTPHPPPTYLLFDNYYRFVTQDRFSRYNFHVQARGATPFIAFVQIGHSVVTLLVALFGAVAARLFAKPRDTPA